MAASDKIGKDCVPEREREGDWALTAGRPTGTDAVGDGRSTPYRGRMAPPEHGTFHPSTTDIIRIDFAVHRFFL